MLDAALAMFLFTGQTAPPLGFEALVKLKATSSSHSLDLPTCFASKGVLAHTLPAAHSVLRVCFVRKLAFLLEGPIKNRFINGTSQSPAIHLASPRNSPLPTQRPEHSLGLLLATDAHEFVEKQVDTGMDVLSSPKVLRLVIFHVEIHDRFSL